jgi:hypothetical protein
MHVENQREGRAAFIRRGNKQPKGPLPLPGNQLLLVNTRRMDKAA